MLNEIFYELFAEGFIYDEDENGLNMSYGEYAAIQCHFQEKLIEAFESYNDFESAMEFLTSEVKSAGDDVSLFFDLEEYQNIYYYIDEDEKTVEICYIPEAVKDRVNSLLEDFLYCRDYQLVS